MGEILRVRNAYPLDQWRQIIQRCQESGLSDKAYCQRQEISGKAYDYWPRKPRAAAVEKAAPQIMELEPEDGRRAEALYIRYRGAELTLPAETGIEAIAFVPRSLRRL